MNSKTPQIAYEEVKLDRGTVTLNIAQGIKLEKRICGVRSRLIPATLQIEIIFKYETIMK